MSDPIHEAVAHEAFLSLSSPMFSTSPWRCQFRSVKVGPLEVSITGTGPTASDACRVALDAWGRANKESAEAKRKALSA